MGVKARNEVACSSNGQSLMTKNEHNLECRRFTDWPLSRGDSFLICLLIARNEILLVTYRSELPLLQLEFDRQKEWCTKIQAGHWFRLDDLEAAGRKASRLEVRSESRAQFPSIKKVAGLRLDAKKACNYSLSARPYCKKLPVNKKCFGYRTGMLNFRRNNVGAWRVKNWHFVGPNFWQRSNASYWLPSTFQRQHIVCDQIDWKWNIWTKTLSSNEPK